MWVDVIIQLKYLVSSLFELIHLEESYSLFLRDETHTDLHFSPSFLFSCPPPPTHTHTNILKNPSTVIIGIELISKFRNWSRKIIHRGR